MYIISKTYSDIYLCLDINHTHTLQSDQIS